MLYVSWSMFLLNRVVGTEIQRLTVLLCSQDTQYISVRINNVKCDQQQQQYGYKCRHAAQNRHPKTSKWKTSPKRHE